MIARNSLYLIFAAFLMAATAGCTDKPKAVNNEAAEVDCDNLDALFAQGKAKQHEQQIKQCPPEKVEAAAKKAARAGSFVPSSGRSWSIKGEAR